MVVCIDMMCLNVRMLVSQSTYVAALWIGGVTRHQPGIAEEFELFSQSKYGALESPQGTGLFTFSLEILTLYFFFQCCACNFFIVLKMMKTTNCLTGICAS